MVVFLLFISLIFSQCMASLKTETKVILGYLFMLRILFFRCMQILSTESYNNVLIMNISKDGN